MLPFHSKFVQLKFNECITYLESFPSIKIQLATSKCTNRICKCIHRSCDSKIKLYSCDNGMDPGPVPPELQGLTQVEEMLILAVLTMMVLYHPPHGMYGYKGHVIKLSTYCKTFLHLPAVYLALLMILTLWLYEERAVWEHTTISVCAWLFCMLYNGCRGTIPTTRIFHWVLSPGTIARGGPITWATCSQSQSTTWEHSWRTKGASKRWWWTFSPLLCSHHPSKENWTGSS